MASRADVNALAAALLRDVADQTAIEIDRLVQLAWAVLTRDELGRLARAALDAPRERALRRSVELAAAVLAAGAAHAPDSAVDGALAGQQT